MVSKKAFVSGMGRMGRRHLAALIESGFKVTVKDISKEIVQECRKEYGERIDTDIANGYDLAIFSETANARVESIRSFLNQSNARYALLEKPVSDTKEGVYEVLRYIEESDCDFHVNFARRSWPFYKRLKNVVRDEKKLLRLDVIGGAFGLACNGIHYIDLANMLFGKPVDMSSEITGTISSARGPTFIDYGGRISVRYERGLANITSMEESYAPTVIILTGERYQYTIDESSMRAVVYDKGAHSEDPYYLTGKDFNRREMDIEYLDLPDTTKLWLSDKETLPTIFEALDSHNILFTALEGHEVRGRSIT